jgi:hypothetical protein
VIERWLIAIRDHPGSPAIAQQLVLERLALRVDWQTGRGFASVRQLAVDARSSEPTVRRATSWARNAELLTQTRRGHRLGNGQIAASEWQLTQPLTGDRLGSQPLNGSASTAQQSDLNRSVETPHQESSSSGFSSSLSARVRELLAAADPAVSERETELIITKIRTSGGRNVLAIIRKNIADGDAPALIADARRTAAYGNGSHAPPVRELCPRCGGHGHTPAECTR